MSIYDVFSGSDRPFDKEEWAAAKQAQRKEAYVLCQGSHEAIIAKDIFLRPDRDSQKSKHHAGWEEENL